ncbi:glycosyltransferase [Fodinicurvata sp. EGI_FJ10296]|uniref:CgeB family protein n=1 Tax=Fodinicurvata sp. EGI_FJ10296 TaxID=3231908 RepID=UPI003453523D
MTTIAFYGSSLLSSYWNGAATYYRGIIRALHDRGYRVTFYEPDAFDRQSHRDIDAPDWARVVVYPATPEGVSSVLDDGAGADVMIKASGVGVHDDLLLTGMLEKALPETVRIFWDVDAPATLAALKSASAPALRQALPALDAVLTYGGGNAVVAEYRALGARDCVPIYNALDPATHFPVAPEPRFAADASFLGNRLPDREARVEAIFFDAARRLPDARFLLAGSGWEPDRLPKNVRHIGHVRTADHNAFNASALAVVNIARDAMAAVGFSPATRVFEALGAGACLITDEWQGLEMFVEPGREILTVRDGVDLAHLLSALTPERAAEIGRAGRQRILADHTYADRAAILTARLAALQSARTFLNPTGTTA